MSHKDKKENVVITPRKGELYLGMEIECLLKGLAIEVELGRLSSVYGTTGAVIYGKHDGTIRENMEEWMPPVVCVELVTQPMTLDCYLNRTWKPIYDRFIKPLKYTTCTLGGHIHLSKSAFTPTQLYKFIKFIRTNLEYIQVVGERSVLANTYCKTSLHSGTSVYQVKHKLQNTDRYEVVNLTSFDTVELRFFGTPYSPEVLYKNAEWCHALWSYVKEAPLYFSAEDFHSFITRCNKQDPTRYKYVLEQVVKPANRKRKLFVVNEESVAYTPAVRSTTSSSSCPRRSSNNDMYTCDDCGCELREDEARWDDRDEAYYCSDCSFYCETCDTLHHQDRMVSIFDSNGQFNEYACSGCASRYFTYCDHCDRYFISECCYSDDSGYTLCDCCRDRLGQNICDNCDLYRTTVDSDGLCDDCRSDRDEEDSEEEEEDDSSYDVAEEVVTNNTPPPPPPPTELPSLTSRRRSSILDMPVLVSPSTNLITIYPTQSPYIFDDHLAQPSIRRSEVDIPTVYEMCTCDTYVAMRNHNNTQGGF